MFSGWGQGGYLGNQKPNPAQTTEPGGDTDLVCSLPEEPEEFPMRPLGLEQPSLEPRPFPITTSSKELSGEDGPALPGPPAQYQQPRPSPNQICLKAEAPSRGDNGIRTPPEGSRVSESVLPVPIPPHTSRPDVALEMDLSSQHPRKYECPVKWPIDIGFKP